MEETRPVAIITGSGAGIGEETSYTFAKQAFSLVLVDMEAGRLQKVVDNMKAMGISTDKILTITEDLSEESSYESIINQTITKFGQIDVLVNNAGFACLNAFDQLTVDIVDKKYKVMLRAPLFLSQKAFPHLKKTKGCIINTCSVAARCVELNAIDYCSMKAGLEHLTRCLALEGASHGVRVNSIHPGSVKTSILSHLPNGDQVFDDSIKSIPMGRLGTTTDMASAILFLSSDAASYITGASLPVDGALGLATSWSGITTD